MFEAVFKIVALVESNGQGERIFKVYEQGTPPDESGFAQLIRDIYQQAIFRTLHAGDTLTITMQHDVPPREIEKTLHFREDATFEGDGLQQPTADLMPVISMMFAQFSKQVLPGNLFSITFHVQRS